MALLTGAFVAGVLLLAIVLVLVEVFSGGPSPTAPSPPAEAPGSVVGAVAGAPLPARAAAAPGPVDAEQLLAGQPALQAGGRPELAFVGAEFSPYSAAVSWAVVAALGRFGTFHRLGAVSTPAGEVFPRTPGLSFYGAGYSSPDVALRAVEAWGDALSTVAPAGYPALATIDGTTSGLLRRYDAADGAGAILPFLDVGNRLILVGDAIGYSPGLLHGMDVAAVATALGDPTSPVARAVLGLADDITAVICAEDGKKPAAVCGDPSTTLAAAHLGLG